MNTETVSGLLLVAAFVTVFCGGLFLLAAIFESRPGRAIVNRFRRFRRFRGEFADAHANEDGRRRMATDWQRPSYLPDSWQ